MKHSSAAAWALTILLADCASAVDPRWPDGAANDTGVLRDAGDVTAMPDAPPPPPSDAGSGPTILPSNGLPCPVGRTCSDRHCGSCTRHLPRVLPCTALPSCPRSAP